MKNILILPFLYLTFISKSQNFINQFNPYLGLANYTVQDQLFSPLIYNGNSFLIGFEKKKNHSKRLQILDFNFATGKMKNQSQNKLKHYVGNISFAYLWPIGTKKCMYLGSSSNTKIAIRQFDLAKIFGAESYSGDLFTSINLNYMYQLSEKKYGSFALSFNTPLFGLALARRSYDIISNPDLIVINDNNIPKSLLQSAEVISLNKIRSGNFELNFSKKLKEKHKINISLEMQIYRYERLNSKVISQNMSIITGYSF